MFFVLGLPDPSPPVSRLPAVRLSAPAPKSLMRTQMSCSDRLFVNGLLYVLFKA